MIKNHAKRQNSRYLQMVWRALISPQQLIQTLALCEFFQIFTYEIKNLLKYLAIKCDLKLKFSATCWISWNAWKVSLWPSLTKFLWQASNKDNPSVVTLVSDRSIIVNLGNLKGNIFKIFNTYHFFNSWVFFANKST